MTWQNIQIPDIFDHKQAFFQSGLQTTILQPDTNLPFEYQNSQVLEPLHKEVVQIMEKVIQIKTKNILFLKWQPAISSIYMLTL